MYSLPKLIELAMPRNNRYECDGVIVICVSRGIVLPARISLGMRVLISVLIGTKNLCIRLTAIDSLSRQCWQTHNYSDNYMLRNYTNIGSMSIQILTNTYMVCENNIIKHWSRVSEGVAVNEFHRCFLFCRRYIVNVKLTSRP